MLINKYFNSFPSLSRRYLFRASPIPSVKIGYSKEIVVEIKSEIPYSEVVKIEVYNGINKKLKSFDPKFPIKIVKKSSSSFLYFFYII